MRIKTSIAFLLLATTAAYAGTANLVVRDGNSVLQTFDVTTDSSGNYVSRFVICDGTAAATCAAIVGTALKVDGSAVTQPVSGTFWQTTQPVSGTFWQATQPISGTFWQATQPASIADGSAVTLGSKADAKSTATDTTAITAMQVLKEISSLEQAPVSRAVTGTFWQATQPVSGTVA